MFSCKQGQTSGSNITKKMFWWNYFVIITKVITKVIVLRNYFAIVSARMVQRRRVGPDVMQSGFEVKFLFWSGEFRKIAGEFLSEFWWRILIANFSALFFQGFRPPKKFTPKIHVQNCRHSSPISLSWTQNLFTAIFCLRGRPRRGLEEPAWIGQKFFQVTLACLNIWANSFDSLDLRHPPPPKWISW